MVSSPFLPILGSACPANPRRFCRTDAKIHLAPTDRKAAHVISTYSNELMELIVSLLWFLKVGFLIFLFLPCPIFLMGLCFAEVKCPPPPGIANGKASGQPSATHLPGSAVLYTCRDGYSLVGNGSITCTAAGTWSRPRPRCEGVLLLAPFHRITD